MGRRVNKLKISKSALSLEEHHEQLQDDLTRLAREDVQNQRCIVLGASNEIIYPMLQSYFNSNTETIAAPNQPSHYKVLAASLLHSIIYFINLMTSTLSKESLLIQES